MINWYEFIEYFISKLFTILKLEYEFLYLRKFWKIIDFFKWIFYFFKNGCFWSEPNWNPKKKNQDLIPLKPFNSHDWLLYIYLFTNHFLYRPENGKVSIGR